jgi:Chaperone of endosialidase
VFLPPFRTFVATRVNDREKESIQLMQSLIQFKKTTLMLFIPLAFACFATSPMARAVSPAPDGCYPGFTTAEGCNALQFLGAGQGNTGVGWYSLYLAGASNFNTGVGAGTLALNAGDSNTAVGAAAMLLNTTGHDNTAVGTDALVFNDGGDFNNAIGSFALHNNIDGSNNCAVGWFALFENLHANVNTAIGVAALLNNDITGNGIATHNTAVGVSALESNIDGNSNTAVGYQALLSSVASRNTAVGSGALTASHGQANTALGADALGASTDGNLNTAVGTDAIFDNTSGSANTAVGNEALIANTTGDGNTAVGNEAGNAITSGSHNVVVGDSAGLNVTTADNVICIGANVVGADVSDTSWIGNVYGVTTQSGTTAAVIVSDTGQLGTVASSERFKKDIATMEKSSETILSLRPVTFHYKTDTKCTPQFGLVAEEVAKVNPALVLPDKEGKPYTVRYDAVNAMLLNEFLKEHRKNEEQGATITELKCTVAQQQKEIEALTAGLQKVSAQLELSKPAPQTVLNDQ